MSYKSHTYEPIVGDRIYNSNPNCKHYRSEGIVIDLVELPKDLGKTIRYICTNSGKSWQEGDVLEKTPDQLSPHKI